MTPGPARSRSRARPGAPTPALDSDVPGVDPAEALVGTVRCCVRRFWKRLVECRRALGDPDAFPRNGGGGRPKKTLRGTSLYTSMWTLRRVYRGQRGPPFSPDEGRLLAALPGVLGETALGNVEKVAMGAENVVVWRWSFEAAGYSIISDDFRSEGEAVAELRLLQRKLYPEWCEEGQREGHLLWLRHVLREERLQAEVMQEPCSGS